MIRDVIPDYLAYVSSQIDSIAMGVVTMFGELCLEGARNKAAIKKAFEGLSKKSGHLARLFVARFFSESRLIAMREMGISSHQWIASRAIKNRGCDHVNDGEVQVIGEPFSHGLAVSGQTTRSGGWCSCITIPIP